MEFRNSFSTPLKTHYISPTNSNRLIQLRAIIAISCENETRHINTLCGNVPEVLQGKAGGTFHYRASRGWDSNKLQERKAAQSV
jgi:hypothetical protein